MEKIIIRKNVLSLGSLSMALVNLTNKKYRSIKKLIEDFGYNRLLKEFFNENIETFESLSKSYNELLKEDKMENENFFVAFKIDEEFGLCLSSNIYLYHIPLVDELINKLTPWYYADSKKYLGDTWWESDDEILQSIQKLPVVDFLKKYKGYIG